MTSKKKRPTGRPRGKKRQLRDLKKLQRTEEWKRQDAERKKRSRTKSGKLRAAYSAKKRLPKERPGLYEESGTVLERRVYRFRGVEGFDLAVDVLTELRDDRPRWTTYVMIGDGYKAGSIWISSRASSPEDSSAWLQGVGITYTKKGGPFAKKKAQLWVEVVAIRRRKKGRAGRK